MSEILNVLKSALGPDEPADTRCIFLVGYLESIGALKVPLEEFVTHGEVFCNNTRISADMWELFLETLILSNTRSVEALNNYRLYIGKEVAAYKNTIVEEKPTGPSVEEVYLGITMMDHETLKSFEKNPKAPGLKPGDVLLNWAKTLDNGKVIRMLLRNTEVGVVLIAVLEEYDNMGQGKVVATSRPAMAVSGIYEIKTNNVTYQVKLMVV